MGVLVGMFGVGIWVVGGVWYCCFDCGLCVVGIVGVEGWGMLNFCGCCGSLLSMVWYWY